MADDIQRRNEKIWTLAQFFYGYHCAHIQVKDIPQKSGDAECFKRKMEEYAAQIISLGGIIAASTNPLSCSPVMVTDLSGKVVPYDNGRGLCERLLS